MFNLLSTIAIVSIIIAVIIACVADKVQIRKIQYQKMTAK